MMGRNPLDKARGKVSRFEGDVAKWSKVAADRSADADEIERSLGEAVLDAEDPDAAGAELTAQAERLRGEARAATSTAEAASRRLDQARRALLREAAKGLRAQATTTRQEAERHHAKTVQLLAQVARHEQVPEWIDQPAPTGHADAVDGSSIVRQPILPATHTAQLAGNADRVEREAVNIERLAEAADIPADAFERALATADPEGPESQRIRQVKADAERQERERKAASELLAAEIRAMREAFDRELVEAGAANHPTAAHNIRIRSVPSDRETPERFTEALTKALVDHRVCDEGEARARAEKAIRAAGREAVNA